MINEESIYRICNKGQFARDNLVYQAKLKHTPFEFTDMSVKTPWDSKWKTKCRTRIRSCHGMIAFISDQTYNSEGVRWEIKCAYEEGIRVYPVYIHDHGAHRIPPELAHRRIYHWTWANISNFLKSL